MAIPYLRDDMRRGSCSFYLFDHHWVFFRTWRVEATVRMKTGPVIYTGPFSFWRRPADWIAFADTKRLAARMLEDMRGGKDEEETITLREYKRLSAKGHPLVLEFGLKNWTEVGKRVSAFLVADYGRWLKLWSFPWKQGQFWPAGADQIADAVCCR